MKRIFSILAAFALIIGLSACGEKAPTWQEQYDLGVRYLSEGNYEEAIIAFTAAIEIDPKQPDAYVGRGDAYMGSGGNKENLLSAQADYEKAIEQDKTNARAYLGLAEIYIAQNDFDAALNIMETGYGLTEDQSLLDRINEINAGNVRDYWGKTRMESHYDSSGALVWSHVLSYKDNRLVSVTVLDSTGSQVDYWDDYQYDEHGNCVCLPEFGGDNGMIVAYNRPTYDEHGRVVERQSYTREGNKIGRTVSEYDSGGLLIGRQEYLGDSPMSHTEYTYDSDGQLIRHDQFDSDGDLLYYVDHAYDDQGRPLRITSYTADNALEFYTEYIYDADGKLVSTVSYNADGTVKSSYNYGG